VESAPSVKVGQEYDVLEVVASAGRYVQLRLDLAPGLPSLWDAEMFATTDASIPSNWVATVVDGGFFVLGPERWRDGFWERYFDDDAAAVAVFEEERAKTLGLE